MDTDIPFTGKCEICAVGWVSLSVRGELILRGKGQLPVIFECLYLLRLPHSCFSQFLPIERVSFQHGDKHRL